VSYGSCGTRLHPRSALNLWSRKPAAEIRAMLIMSRILTGAR